ncbi:MAG: hypothetical protein A2383_01360 [Candidatus Pacebacteria bacterium RIFOXYB1_FULL_39_46]|nr:MAG: hypothetical protein A2383_01360 [Candidatus Pacebacteria bacterium RIFOXYB1_FULL_39_46]OGJ39039.1 MAG: hypothetical protein A2182_01780 [Candidatus Pacebacteria bacterium RIFOXYA1_FULL_38_18]OGJ40010.1 MAG: hypothetical protein A2582_01305 [Candidatus Pacebacteria bacterium RIFOXYD1_FULL_39_27]OGJ40728.1 MAG: hypothetical protein A2411_00390 [Candidatus Pacebacteria bacterium RIFOXYC1_FULL_39_21]
MLKLPRKIKSLSRIRTGVKALIVNEGKILVVQERLAKDHPDDEQIIHDFPGGGLDLGESLITGLKREVKEEIGLEIEVGQVVGAWDFVVSHLDNPTKGVQIVCIGYQCQVKGKKLKFNFDHNPAQEDIFAAKWLTPEEILASNPPLFRYPGMNEAVKAVQAQLQTKK